MRRLQRPWPFSSPMRRGLQQSTPAAAAAGLRRLQLQQRASQPTTRAITMGCGSNVLDQFYPLRRFPKV